jgi:hypothetical protein
MKHGQIDYRVGWIAAIVAVAGMLFLSIDIAIKHSNSPVASTATGANTFASVQSGGAKITPSDRRADTGHPTQTQ